MLTLTKALEWNTMAFILSSDFAAERFNAEYLDYNKVIIFISQIYHLKQKEAAELFVKINFNVF